MLNKLLVIAILFGAWHWWSQRHHMDTVDSPSPKISEMILPKVPAKSTQIPLASAKPPKKNSNFQCDGRQHCSQMRSRAEAEFFVANCPIPKWMGIMMAFRAKGTVAGDSPLILKCCLFIQYLFCYSKTSFF